MKKVFLSFLVASLLLVACQNKPVAKVKISNPTDFGRNEVVEVDLTKHNIQKDNIVVIDGETKDTLVIQQVDSDNDNVLDLVYLQVNVLANASKELSIYNQKSIEYTSNIKTFGRFVPERTDDFTWENDKVAFRVFGPTAQKMVEEGVKGGTYSGGVDCWLKKVDYSIIDKWYKGNTEKSGYYHIDHGEGIDNYHVGPSLGCGGTGVMINSELVTSINYTAYKVLKNGPLKTVFNLDYAPFGNDSIKVSQKKQVSIKLGDNFSKYVINVEGTDTLTTGVTLHDNKGVVSTDSTAVWANYWAPHHGEELGNTIVLDPKYFAGFKHVVSEEKDKSHILVNLKVIDGKVEYYSGFAWSGSGQFKSKEEWESYLNQFSKSIQHPIVVEFIK